MKSKKSDKIVTPEVGDIPTVKQSSKDAMKSVKKAAKKAAKKSEKAEKKARKKAKKAFENLGKKQKSAAPKKMTKRELIDFALSKIFEIEKRLAQVDNSLNTRINQLLPL